MTPHDATDATAVRLTLLGRVQGLGVRPAIARLAQRLGLAGSVSNGRSGVTVVLEGAATTIESFRRLLPGWLPAEAHVERLDCEVIQWSTARVFRITEESAPGPVATRVPVDRRVCDTCLADVRNPGDCRHEYPFTSCAECGPRFSIVTSMPYDRPRTSMAAFPLCDSCGAEYQSPADRRFHAQTIACPHCGPHVWCADASGATLAVLHDAIRLAASALRDGRLVAIRGIGGYQILADATNAAAIDRLRQRKRRATKPLAVMLDSLAMAEQFATIDPAERNALLAAANPIVLLRARCGTPLSGSVHPGLDTIGVMLPTTPLHALLLDGARRPLIVTSGNVEGDPLAAGVAAAREQLGDVVDLWLHHDREIVHPIDDSVVRVMAGRAVTIRLARGLAPLPLALNSDRCVVALGAHQKGAMAVSNGRQAVLGPHLGDLESAGTRARFQQQFRDLMRLLGGEPELLVHDLHPDYFTTRWAREQGLPTVAVQHHHAHVVAGMLEHDWLNREVLGVAFDGTGYGSDGTIWGGEFLVATRTRFRRVAHLRPFPLPGGAAAIREPWRVAAALLHSIRRLDSLPDIEKRGVPKGVDLQSLVRVLGNPRLSPVTTSVGRLFDAAAFLTLGCDRVGEEGSPAMLLEAACDVSDHEHYPLPLCDGRELILDWAPLLVALLADRARRVPVGVMAMRFHRALARGIATVCGRFPGVPVVLSGGVFQNRILTELAADELARDGRLVGLPGVIPPNDGGIAAGQLAVALARLDAGELPSCA